VRHKQSPLSGFRQEKILLAKHLKLFDSWPVRFYHSLRGKPLTFQFGRLVVP